MPSRLITRNLGMSRTTPGTDITPINMAKTTLRPGKCSRASA